MVHKGGDPGTLAGISFLLPLPSLGPAQLASMSKVSRKPALGPDPGKRWLTQEGKYRDKEI